MKNILIVDDEFEIRSLIEEYLLENNFVIHQAATCDAAREVLKTYPIDLVLLDISMPVEDGRNLTANCKELSPMPKIIFISSFATIVEDDPRIKIATAILPKPFSCEELLAAINKALSTH